jgi:hypothetical protein
MEFNIDELSDFDTEFEYKNDFDCLQDNINKTDETVNKPSLNSFQTIKKQQPVQHSKQQPQQPQQPQQTKSISYDDILSNMNVCLVNGKLQFNRTDEGVKSQKPPNKSVRFQPQQQQQQRQQPQQQPQRQQNQRNQRNLNTHQPYYQEQSQQPVAPPQPLTPQEKKRLFIIQQLQQQVKINHLNNVKSKKLLIPNPNIHSSSSMGLGGSRPSIPADRLFRLRGR